MSDTPRTDAVCHNVPELAMFARRLERELADARAENNTLVENLADAQLDIAEEIKHGETLKRELAEARAQVAALRAVLASDAPRAGQTSTIGALLANTAEAAEKRMETKWTTQH